MTKRKPFGQGTVYNVLSDGQVIYTGTASDISREYHWTLSTIRKLAAEQTHIVPVDPYVDVIDLPRLHMAIKQGTLNVQALADHLALTKSSVYKRLSGIIRFTESEVAFIEQTLGLPHGELNTQGIGTLEKVDVDMERLKQKKKEFSYTHEELGQHLGLAKAGMLQKYNGRVPFRDYEVKILEDLFFLDEGELIK